MEDSMSQLQTTRSIDAVTATDSSPTGARRDHHVCPWWVGYLLASPLRRLFENPTALLSPHLRPGMTVLDLGSAMGFFSLPAARLVGAEGRVVCLDVQQRMLASLIGRARRRGLADVIEPRLCTQVDLGIADLEGAVDFAVAINVVHETMNPDRVLRECLTALRPGARMVLSEPKGHVKAADFARTIEQARTAGFVPAECGGLKRNQTVLLEKPA
jgi:2-polyprenyl-3-methyl-5-hydroxy-6-metoxy-1,4-benzoquinol methylase